MKKKSFSLIEVLYGLTVLSIIASISFISFSKQINQDKIIELKKSGIRALKAQDQYYEKNGNYDNVDETTVDSTEKVYGDNGTLFHLTEGYIFQTSPISCDDGTTGVYIKMQDPKIETYLRENYIEYNSCEDTAIIRPDK